MTHQDKISIIITFVVGGLVGGYMYLVGFAPTYHLPEASTQDEYADLVITADSYGACELDDTCMSFQFLQDGSYRAIVAGVSYDGSISRSLRIKLQNAMLEETLLVESAPVEDSADCHYGNEETNFKFVVTIAGNNYQLDSCRSAIKYEGIIWTTLTELWSSIVADLG